MKVVPTQVTVAKATQAFDEAGDLLRPEDKAALRQLTEELTQAMKAEGVAV